MKPFIKIDKIGELNVDVVLFESYYPILFTCLNENKEIFLCVCCQSNSEGRKWLITRTTPKIVIKVLKNELTVREAFLKFPQVQITVFNNTKSTMIYEHNKMEWDADRSMDLPDKDEFLDAEDGEFDDEILYFESMDDLDYNTSFQKIEISFSNKKIDAEKNYIEKIDLANIYYKDVEKILKSSEIYIKIKKEMQDIIFDKCQNGRIQYNEIFEEKKVKYSTKNFSVKQYDNIDISKKQISEAA